MKSKTILLLLSLLFIFCFSIAVFGKDTGKAEMILGGGSKGNIAFPHGSHQQTITDCTSCHNLFPQETGSIDKLKNEGGIKKKQVMKQCQKCHREMKRAGEKTGPTKCSGCHDKSLTR
ncbi:MAG: cytochrome c3 family protein [Desulfobacterales bacterium]|nr:cytochrome c3 family protein [Desulfobacterales bacterium]